MKKKPEWPDSKILFDEYVDVVKEEDDPAQLEVGIDRLNEFVISFRFLDYNGKNIIEEGTAYSINFKQAALLSSFLKKVVKEYRITNQ